MPRSSTTGLQTRVDNSFSQPVFDTVVDEGDADAYFDDVEAALNAFIGTSTTSLEVGTGAKTFTTQTGKAFLVGTFVQALSQADRSNYMVGTVTSYDSGTGELVLNVVAVAGSGTLADWLLYTGGAASAEVPAATETQAGKVELATSAETVAGTDTARATHAAGVKAAIDDRILDEDDYASDSATKAPSQQSTSVFVRNRTAIKTLRYFGIVPFDANADVDEDQATELQDALDSGYRLDGEGLWYGQSAELTSSNPLILSNAKIKRLGTYDASFIALSKTGGSLLRIHNLEYDRNGADTDGAVGAHNDNGVIHTSGTERVIVTGSKIYGAGMGFGIRTFGDSQILIAWNRISGLDGSGFVGADEKNVGIWPGLSCRGLITGNHLIGPGADVECDAISCSGVDGVGIIGNTLTDWGEGVDVSGSQQNRAAVIQSNLIERMGNVGVKLIHMADECKVANNTINDCGLSGIGITGGDPTDPDVDYGPRNCQIHNNTISRSGSDGVHASSTQPSRPTGILITTHDNDTSNTHEPENCVVSNNTIFDDQGSPTMQYGIRDATTNKTTRVYDNIVSDATTNNYQDTFQYEFTDAGGRKQLNGGLSSYVATPTLVAPVVSDNSGTSYLSGFEARVAGTARVRVGWAQADFIATGLPAGPYLASTDSEPIRVSINGKIAGKFDETASGWLDAGETWTYASATTFTISGDLTGKYQVGDRLKLTQTTAKYFYIIGASHAAGTTTVTVTGGSDYTLANATITAPYWSRQPRPFGFPGFFNHSPSYTGFSANPTNIASRFNLTNRLLTWYHREGTNGTSNATSTTISLPVTAATISNAGWNVPTQFIDNGSTGSVFGMINIGSGGTVANAFTRADAGAWTGSGGKRVTGFCIQYEI